MDVLVGIIADTPQIGGAYFRTNIFYAICFTL